MLYSVTVTFIFKVKHFLIMPLFLKNRHSSDVPGRFALTTMAPAVELLLLKKLFLVGLILPVQRRYALTKKMLPVVFTASETCHIAVSPAAIFEMFIF